MFDNLFANYRQVAARLGLSVDAGGNGFRVVGSLEGEAVQTYFGVHAVTTAALWGQSPDTTLSIATKGILERIAELFGAGHGKLGDPELDAAFSFQARDIHALATHVSPELRASLLLLVQNAHHPSIDAREVKMWRFTDSAQWDAEASIEQDLRLAVRLAKETRASFAGL